jgi:hypothetical protein
MVQVVNYLRKLGKEKCLAVLRSYLECDGGNYAVLILCRLLFVNPKGWPQPSLGQPRPVVNKDVAKQFPLFPIAVSDNVPFLLVNGYRVEGVDESAADCVKLCEGLSLINKDYSTSDHEKAARTLTETESFRRLYLEKDLQVMVEIVTGQTRTAEAADIKK